MRARRLFILIFLTISILDVTAQRRKNRGVSNDVSKQIQAEYYFTEAEKFYILEDYAKALAMFQKSLEIDPQNAAAYYKKAQIELENDNFNDAEKDINRALELDPQNKYYYLLKIDILQRKGDLDKVAEIYEILISNLENTSGYMYELANIYLYLKQYNKAVDVYERLEKINGFTSETAFQKHHLYSQIGEKEKALKCLEDLYNKYPDEENYCISLSEYLINIGEDEQALTILKQFSQNHKGTGKINLLIGEIYRKNKQYTEAYPYLEGAFADPSISADLKIQLISQYRLIPVTEELNSLIASICETLIEHHDDEANAHAIYGDFLYETGHPDNAILAYERSIELDDSNYSVWQNLLLLYTNGNQFNEVIDISDEVLELFPNQTIFYYLAGFANLRERHYENAVIYLNQGKRMVRNQQELIDDFNSLLGEAYNGLKDFPKSDKAFEEVLKSNPDNYLVLNNYSYYLALRNENLDLAEKMSGKLAKENPEDATYMDTHAWVLFKRNKFKEAKKILEKAVLLQNVKAVHIEHYGDVLFKLGDIDGAVKQWEKARSMDSTLEFIDRKIRDKKLYEK